MRQIQTTPKLYLIKRSIIPPLSGNVVTSLSLSLMIEINVSDKSKQENKVKNKSKHHQLSSGLKVARMEYYYFEVRYEIIND